MSKVIKLKKNHDIIQINGQLFEELKKVNKESEKIGRDLQKIVEEAQKRAEELQKRCWKLIKEEYRTDGIWFLNVKYENLGFYLLEKMKDE